MSEQGVVVRFDELSLRGARGFSVRQTVVDAANCQITCILHGEGAGHGLHRHEDTDEILVFLEGRCLLGLGDVETEVRGGSLAFAPRGVPHSVKFLAPSKVLRIRFPLPQPRA